ncbi:unnamed protein product [Choristocarpus tenellus]|uniref:30S ribosomal protein S5 n=1 Tax=Choristocarpus tenellus TaxID=116065 RepID=UPI002E79F2A5|nr:30S ribosomal protein S5 [Choristocarpus tenellus]WAM62317.1 30S ribosomal protein S5 [Choristocarpus tenellus]
MITQHRIVKISRISKVVKGGKKINFRVIIVSGNENKIVGVGVGKAKEIVDAIRKALNNSKKNLINVPIIKGQTIPHSIIGKAGSSKVFIRPAIEGTGVIAGSSVRIVLELAGIKNILTKQLGSNNALNNARATITALKKLSTIDQVIKNRQISLEQLSGT